MSSKLNDPFGIGFVLPEHRRALEEYEYEKTLVKQPAIDEHEYTEMCYLIQRSMLDNFPIRVTWWRSIKRDLGEFQEVTGRITKIDHVHNQMKVTNGNDFTWVDMTKIVGIQEAE